MNRLIQLFQSVQRKHVLKNKKGRQFLQNPDTEEMGLNQAKQAAFS